MRVVVALGQIAHVAAARALGLPPSGTKFGHGAEALAPDGRVLLSSYHCSRYNQNTRKLDTPMFESVFARACALPVLDQPAVKLRPAVAEEAEGGAVLLCLRRGRARR